MIKDQTFNRYRKSFGIKVHSLISMLNHKLNFHRTVDKGIAIKCDAILFVRWSEDFNEVCYPALSERRKEPFTSIIYRSRSLKAWKYNLTKIKLKILSHRIMISARQMSREYGIWFFPPLLSINRVKASVKFNFQFIMVRMILAAFIINF